MKRSDEWLRMVLMNYFQRRRGKEHATPREEVLRFLKMYDPSVDDRRMRRIYSGLPVCSSDGGLFLPKRPEEVEEFRSYLTKGWGPVLAERRVQIIYAFYPHLKENHQASLFGANKGGISSEEKRDEH